MMLPFECYPHVISLGGGVQSSTMALMASEGLIKPAPRFAIFADTQDEPASVYRWLEWLKPRLSFPVVVESRGKLSDESTVVKVSKKNKVAYQQYAPPAFTWREGGEVGLLMRQCTVEFKLKIIYRYIKRRFPYGSAVQWIGISTNEAGRMKPCRESRIHNRYPLIELGMSRDDCLGWMRGRGYPDPPRSACVQCPYHSDDEWLSLKDNEPEEFEKAVQYERRLQDTFGRIPTFEGTVFLHKSLIPLSEVKFKSGDNPKAFVNECEGMCGV
jgi:hypothetical protein